jgi:hypothetical protein
MSAAMSIHRIAATGVLPAGLAVPDPHPPAG